MRVPQLADFEWQRPVLAIESTPPATPTKGDRYIVGANATDAWELREDEIVWYNGTAWDFDTSLPKSGWFVYVIDEGFFYRFVDTAWERFTSSPIPVTDMIDDADSPYSIGETDIIIVDTSSGNVTVTLPDIAPLIATEDQRAKIIYKDDYSNNVIFVETTGSDTINGSDRVVISGLQEAIILNPTTNGWVIETGETTSQFQDRTIYLKGTPSETPPNGYAAVYVDGNGVPSVKGDNGEEKALAFDADKAGLSDVTKTGTNANGRWIKTYLTEHTGILKCVGTISTTVDTNNVSGNVFGSGTINIPWPEEFESAPSFCATLSGQTRRWLGSSALATSTTQGNVTVMSYQSETGVSVSISFEATGTFDDTPA